MAFSPAGEVVIMRTIGRKKIPCGHPISRTQRCQRPIKAPRWQCGVEGHRVSQGWYESKSGNCYSHADIVHSAVFGSQASDAGELRELHQLSPDAVYAKEQFVEMMNEYEIVSGDACFVDDGRSGVNEYALEGILDILEAVPESRSEYLTGAKHRLINAKEDYSRWYRDYTPSSNVAPWSELADPPDGYRDAEHDLAHAWEYATSLAALEYADTACRLRLVEEAADGSMAIHCHDPSCDCGLRDYECVLKALADDFPAHNPQGWGNIDKSPVLAAA